MQYAPNPANEEERLEAVKKLGLLDNLNPEKRFDVFTKEATEKLNVPISTLTILDAKREHYKSCQGLNTTDGERAISFCGHALLVKELFMINDCKDDPRFADNPMVTGEPFIRFYAGIALYDFGTGMPVAVFCVKDRKPRNFSVKEIGIFLDLASRVEEELNGVTGRRV